jgi:hypothetical protein
MSMHGIEGLPSRSERGRTAILLSIPVVVVLVTVVVALMGRMEFIPLYLVGLGVLAGVILAVYDGIADRRSGNGDWGWLLLVYPLLLVLPLWFAGLLVLALYNLFVHGAFALDV